MGDLTAHFDQEEFSDRRGGGVKGPPARTLAALEVLRFQVGRPLRIVSGYRTPMSNRAVGGAPDSRHLYGDAADIPEGYATVDQAVAAGFTGIGSRGRWVIHVDTRPGPLVQWSYPTMMSPLEEPGC